MATLVSVPTPPVTTMSFDTQVYVGQNKIRRNVGTYTSMYVGTSVTDRILDLAPAALVTITEPMTAVVIKTSQPITVTLDATNILYVNSFLALDSAILTSLKIQNNAANTLNASVHLTYLS